MKNPTDGRSATQAPSKTFLAIHSKQLQDGVGVVDEGFIIIPLSEYDSCTYQYSKILRVSFSKSKLNKWLRSYRYKISAPKASQG